MEIVRFSTQQLYVHGALPKIMARAGTLLRDTKERMRRRGEELGVSPFGISRKLYMQHRRTGGVRHREIVKPLGVVWYER